MEDSFEEYLKKLGPIDPNLCLDYPMTYAEVFLFNKDI